MADYLFYTYFEDGNEYFVYKDLRFERSHTKEKDFPFLESLLRFTYLDIWPMEDLFKKMDRALLDFYREHDFDSQRAVMSTLEELAKKHIYFEFLRLDWQARFRLVDRYPDEDTHRILPHKQLRHIPSDLDTLQKQIMRLFQDVLTSTTARRNLCRRNCKPTSTRRRESRSMLTNLSPSPPLMSEPGRGLSRKSSTQPPSLTW